ncbi:MAG: hypothetical protein ACLGPM_07825 [Acidobacteriota bacterium]
MTCARCDHPLSKHCKGNVAHVYHKDDMVKNPRTTTCTMRHCLNPMWSCIDYIEPQEKPNAV